MKKMKKILSVLCVSAVLLSYLDSSIIWSAYAENTETDNTEAKKTETTKELAAPQNLHEENGFIIWDETPDAYGYSVKACKDDWEINIVYYTNCVELKRFFYENNMEFGECTFEVCAFDETNNMSEYSNPVTATYAPTLDTPANVRLSEDNQIILWDEVTGAVRYNTHIFKSNDNNEREEIEGNRWETQNLLSVNKYISGANGDYWYAFQAMDEDYNVSEWTAPVLVSYKSNVIGVPKNVRFDDTGESILWDEVDGATSYVIQVSPFFGDGDFGYSFSRQCKTSNNRLDNWKSLTVPFADEYSINVRAEAEGYISIVVSDSLRTDYSPVHDEMINVPENIWLEDDYLRWDEIEGVKEYWLYISAGESYVRHFHANINEVYIGNLKKIPSECYTIELFVVDGNNNYNSKNYSLILDTIHDETVWIPEMSYKFETLLWTYDKIRHEKTESFWVRIKKGENVVRLVNPVGEEYEGLKKLPDGDYEIQICVYEKGDKIGKWSEPLKISKHGEGLFDKENEVSTDIELTPDAGKIPEEDKITSITINPAFNMKNKNDINVELDLSKIKIKAKEIYDEEGLKRASEALGEKIEGNKHYNLLDLTLFEGDRDISNNYEGLVQVIIPLPKGHRNKRFSCYRLTEVDGKMSKEEIPGEQTEDSYIIYLEHFSEYALVADEHNHAYGENWTFDENSHWKECECGVRSEEKEHIYGAWKIIKEATENEEGTKERTCEKCGYKVEEIIPKKTNEHTHVYKQSWEFNEDSHWKECECGARSEESEHIYGAWKTTKEATESEDGIKERSCEKCGYKVTEIIPKISYTHTHAYGESWELDENSHWKECECGNKSEESEHAYGAWKTIREATENEEGIRERSCNVCGYKQTGNLPKLIVSTPSESNKFDDKPNEKPDDKLKEIPKPDNQNPDTGDCLLDTSYSVLLICCSVITLLAKKRSLKEKYTNK